MKRQSRIFILVYVVCGAVILLILARYMISQKAVPSLSDFIASSTDQGATSTQPGFSTATSSLTQNTPSTPPVQNTISSSRMIAIQAPLGIIHTEIVDQPEARSRGLSGRASLMADQGMLFIFPEPGMYGFWMKDMHFSLDFVWIDADRKIAGVTENISPDTYPNAFLPPSPISYALEINAGQAKKFGLKNGVSLTF